MNIEIEIAKPKIDAQLLAELQVDPEKCTIVHCKFFTKEITAMRIWKSTFLVQDTGSKAKLLHAISISLMPQWTLYETENDFIRFTLVFEGLDRNCESFHLLEHIPEPGGFMSETAMRNKTDVYELELFSA